MNQLEKAKMVAKWAHQGQKDMGDQPYWTHCHRVATLLKGRGFDETTQVVGWLHDVVEDTTFTIADLAELGFADNVLSGVAAMTQGPDEPLEQYWPRVKANPIARNVKLFGDVPDNNDMLRQELALATGGTEKRVGKLRRKYGFLTVYLTDPDMDISAIPDEFRTVRFPDHAVDEWTQPQFASVAFDVVT